MLLLTERAHGEAMHQAFLSGAHDCLIKPIDDNELLRIPALQRRTQTGGERCRNLSFLLLLLLCPLVQGNPLLLWKYIHQTHFGICNLTNQSLQTLLV